MFVDEGISNDLKISVFTVSLRAIPYAGGCELGGRECLFQTLESSVLCNGP